MDRNKATRPFILAYIKVTDSLYYHADPSFNPNTISRRTLRRALRIIILAAILTPFNPHR